MPIPGTLEVRGWFVTAHAVENFKNRYGWEQKSDEEVRKKIGDLLNACRPEQIYEFHSSQNRTTMNIYHADDCCIQSYFLVNPDQRPPAVITVHTTAQFRNFWNALPSAVKVRGPEKELSVDNCLIQLSQKDEIIEVLNKKLKKEKEKTDEFGKVLNAVMVVWDFFSGKIRNRDT